MTSGALFIGIDVSKVHLDVAVHPTGAQWREDHDEEGTSRLVQRLTRLQPALVVVEATGGLERLLACALGVASVPVAVVNPRQVRDFAKAASDEALTDLANFLREGLINQTLYIDYAGKTPRTGNIDNGRTLFNRICAECHDEDGKEINFDSDAEPEYVGTVAKGNPWEALHKIMFGQPDTKMPAGTVRGWTIQEMLDVLAYVRTLPAAATGEGPRQAPGLPVPEEDEAARPGRSVRRGAGPHRGLSPQPRVTRQRGVFSLIDL